MLLIILLLYGKVVPTYPNNVKCRQSLQNVCMRAIYKLDNKTNID